MAVGPGSQRECGFLPAGREVDNDSVHDRFVILKVDYLAGRCHADKRFDLTIGEMDFERSGRCRESSFYSRVLDEYDRVRQTAVARYHERSRHQTFRMKLRAKRIVVQINFPFRRRPVVQCHAADDFAGGVRGGRDRRKAAGDRRCGIRRR